MLMDASLPLYKPGSGYHERNLQVESELYDIVARARADKFSPWITPCMKVFEFGVGTGVNMAALRCRARVGYDVCSLMHELQRSRIRFRWETASMRSAQFDAVICHHVLEHVTDPWRVISEMRRLLVPDGVLVLHVPYEIERSYVTFNPKLDNGHLFSWTPQTLGSLLVGSGFDVERIGVQKFGYDRFAARLVGKVCPTDVLYRAVRWALLTLRPRYEIAAVCRKPR